MKNSAIIFKLPFPPSVNKIWNYSSKQVYLSKQTINFRDEVAIIARKQNVVLNIDSPVKVTVVLHPKNNRKRDLDNFGSKALFDALTHANVWKDDSIVKGIHLAWGDLSNKPYIDVAIQFYQNDWVKSIDQLLEID